MPVRSLNSRVVKWPDASQVLNAVTVWAQRQAALRDDLDAVGIMGSYARGDWGVGSDVDIVVVVKQSALPFMSRAREWTVQGIPVPADVLVYTGEEWEAMCRGPQRSALADAQVYWVYRHPSLP